MKYTIQECWNNEKNKIIFNLFLDMYIYEPVLTFSDDIYEIWIYLTIDTCTKCILFFIDNIYQYPS